VRGLVVHPSNETKDRGASSRAGASLLPRRTGLHRNKTKPTREMQGVAEEKCEHTRSGRFLVEHRSCSSPLLLVTCLLSLLLLLPKAVCHAAATAAAEACDDAPTHAVAADVTAAAAAAAAAADAAGSLVDSCVVPRTLAGAR
jgi:hypothetical protein